MKRFLSTVSALLVTGILLSACNTGGTTKESEGKVDNTDNKTEDTTTADPAPSGDVVEITFMPNKTELQAEFEEIVDEYNKSQSEVKVTILGTSGDNFTTVLQSNFSADAANAPTIFALSGPTSANFEQFFADLSGTEAAGRIPEGLKAEFLNDQNQVTGLPGAVEGYGMIYNVKMFEDAGIDPASLTSIDTFVSALETLSKVDGVQSPLAFAKEEYFIFIHFFNWAVALQENYEDEIAAVNAGEKTFADLAMVQKWGEALDKITEFSNKGLSTYDEQVAGFGAGQFAMIHQGNWAQSVLEQNDVSFDYAFLPYPLEGNQGLAVGTSSAWRVNNKADEAKQEGAKKFLDWLILSETGQKLSAEKLKSIPAYTDVEAPVGGLSESVAKYVSENKTVNWAFNNVFPPGIEVNGARLMQEYYAGDITSTKLLEELTAEWQKLAK